MKNTIEFKQPEQSSELSSNYTLACNDNSENKIKVPLTGEEAIFTTCPKCGKQFSFDLYALFEMMADGDLYGTQTYCPQCSEEMS